MNAPPYQKLFWGSYHKHTAHLSHAREHGAYLLLIGALWNNEGRLPADDDTLAGYAKLTGKEWLAIKPKLINGSLLKIVRGKLTQPRVTEDLAKYRDTSGKRKQAGKAGGLASSGKRTGNMEANAADLPTKPEPEPEEENPPTPQGGRRKPKRSIPDGFPDQPLVDEQQAKARAAGANVDIVNQAERFRNWSIGKDARYADWPATWRNWCDRAIRDAPKTAVASLAQRQAQSQPDDARWRSRLREFRQNRYWPKDDAGPAPGAPGCRVPPALLTEFGFTPSAANDPKPDLFAKDDAA